MNPYEKLINRKRKWTPVQTTAGTCKEGAEEAIHRALALRHMELPVGDFITDALSLLKYQVMHENFSTPTFSTKRTTTSHLVTSPMLTALMKKLRRKPLGLKPLGRHIQITRLPKHLLPSVRSSSFFYHSFALMVTLA